MIQFHQVSKAYRGGQQALQRVDFYLPRGDIAFLTGHSGAGKSTLLKLLCALERPSDGQIIFDGNDISRLPISEIPFLRRNIGIIFQDHKLLMNKTVFDNVALPLRVDQASETTVRKRVSAALEKVGLIDKAECLPIQLSGGEQQRVGIARAVVNKPLVLVADEPTGNLDPVLSQQIMELFFQFNKVGVTILMATHDVAILSRYQHIRHFNLVQGHLSEVVRG